MIVASIDIGSNTVLMLITEVSPDELKIILQRDGSVYPNPESLYEAAEFILNDLQIHLKINFQMLPDIGYAPVKTITLASTPVILVCIHKGLKNYDVNKVEVTILSIHQIAELLIMLSQLSPEQLLLKYPSILTGRERFNIK